MTKTATTSTGNSTGWSLTTQQQVQLGFSAFDDVLNYFSSLNSAQKESFQYQFQSWQSQQNASIYASEAKDVLRQGAEQENQMREEGLRQRADQRTAMSASGFDVSSKSYQDILSETDRQIENNAATIRENTMSAYASKKYQQRMSEIQGDLYSSAASIAKKSSSSWGSLISAGAKTAALAYFG